jgi:hypothetical protein
MKRWTNGLPGATARLGANMALRGLSVNQLDRALISMVARSNKPLQSEAGYIYGQPRLRKAQLMWTGRLPAVIYPVSSDPDGFRGTTPNH